MEKNVPISGVLKKEVEVFERSYYLLIYKVNNGLWSDQK